MNTNIMPFDARDLRKAFGSFGTGVTVVTAKSNDERRIGVTVNSFSSVSLSPPIVAWSLSNNSPNLAAFHAAGRFVINVLTIEQLRLSRQFSSSASDKFAGVSCSEGLAGQPLIDDCAATLECLIVASHTVGDHCLFLGQVERYTHAPVRPLLFCQGSYQRGIELIEPSMPAMVEQRMSA